MKLFRILCGAMLLSLLPHQAQAQVYKFMTTGYSVKERTGNDKWSEWSALQPTSMMVNLDTGKNRLVIYSQEIQLYNIIDYLPEQENDTDLVYGFECSDENGMPFTISIITRKKQGNRKQLYINQKDVIIVYNIVNFYDKNER